MTQDLSTQDQAKSSLIKTIRADSKMVFDHLEENLDKVPIEMLQKLADSGKRLRTLMVK